MRDAASLESGLRILIVFPEIEIKQGKKQYPFDEIVINIL